jgi:hypothetical protein
MIFLKRYAWCYALDDSVASQVRGSTKAACHIGEHKGRLGYLMRNSGEEETMRDSWKASASKARLFHTRTAIVCVVDDRLGSWDMGHYILLEYFILGFIKKVYRSA